MKIIILGRGYLGKEFERQGYEVWGSSSPFCTKANNQYQYHWDALKDYDVIVNCIGKSDTRWCENLSNQSSLLYSNVTIPMLLSRYCKEHNKQFVHISTGCLYDNTRIENREDGFLAAHCQYTLSKWLAENHCDKNRDLILRPRLYYNNINDPKNLLTKIQRFSRFIYNQQDSLTAISTIVSALKALLDNNQTGIFNVAQEGSASIYQIAEWCGISPLEKMTDDELRAQEGLYLVNNVMNISKLKQFYIPDSIEKSIKENWKKLRQKEEPEGSS